MTAPVRLNDPTSNASDVVRALLRSASSDGPSAAELAQLGAQLAPVLEPLPPPSPTVAGTSATSGPAVTAGAHAGAIGSAVVKVAIVFAVAAGGYWFSRSEQSPPPPPSIEIAAVPIAGSGSGSTSLATEIALTTVTTTPPSIGPSPATATATPRKRRRPHVQRAVVTPVPARVVDQIDEVTLLDTAQRALAMGDLRAALATAARHQQQFPAGSLNEEREAIAIEALIRLGRTAEALPRLDRFRSRFPRSGYRDQLDRLLPNP
ncbi:MAG: hypothetical protein AB7O24_23155 [Kofleriaceae bacterium]